MADKLQPGKFESYTVIVNGLIETDLLTEHEKMVYIVIRKHLNQEKQKAFPGMTTISREARVCKSVVIKAIQGLEEKGLLTVKRQTTKYNEKKTNIYSFNDFSELWKAKTVDELKKIATGVPIQLTDDEIIDKALKIDKKSRQKLYNKLAKEFEKENGLETTAPTKVTVESSTIHNNLSADKSNTDTAKSQGEEYTMQDVQALFDYSILMADYPEHEADLNVVFDILHEVLNTSKQTIRIGGEDKPKEVVKGKLMKLESYDIVYAIDKFHEQVHKIKNTRAYLLTILYHAREQSYLDLMNLGHRNGDF